MPKKNLTTRELVLNKALELYNERGLEYVGTRELAKALNVHVGNVSYYFPKKEDLLVALSAGLRELNDSTIVPMQQITLYDMLLNIRQAFINHYKYRCLLLSFVQAMENYPAIYMSYKKTEGKRRKALLSNFQALRKSALLQATVTDEDIEELVSLLMLVARFWISESRVTYRGKSTDWLIKHYLKLLTNVLEPIATAKGKKELRKFAGEFL